MPQHVDPIVADVGQDLLNIQDIALRITLLDDAQLEERLYELIQMCKKEDAFQLRHNAVLAGLISMPLLIARLAYPEQNMLSQMTRQLCFFVSEQICNHDKESPELQVLTVSICQALWQMCLFADFNKVEKADQVARDIKDVMSVMFLRAWDQHAFEMLLLDEALSVIDSDFSRAATGS